MPSRERGEASPLSLCRTIVPVRRSSRRARATRSQSPPRVAALAATIGTVSRRVSLVAVAEPITEHEGGNALAEVPLRAFERPLQLGDSNCVLSRLRASKDVAEELRSEARPECRRVRDLLRKLLGTVTLRRGHPTASPHPPHI